MYLQNKYTMCYYSIINRAMSRELSTDLYTEKHHIIPKSLGGSNTLTNIVKLTAREHFVCHLLLPKMLTGINKRSMTFALWSMINRDHSVGRLRYKINSRMHESIRVQVASAASELHKGKIVTAETRDKMSAKAKGRVSGFKDKTHTDLSNQKNSAAHNGKRPSKETVEKILKSRQHYRHSEETKTKISESNKGKTVIVTDETRQKISNTLKGRVPTWLVGKQAHNRGIAHSAETVAKLSIPKPKITCPHCGAVVGGHANYNRWHGDNCKHLK